ncbi:MAG: hypothetical protein WAM70_07205, partial [Pyrinomonadaceae bacterium]
MTNSPLKASDLKGKIHAAIITIRQDEYEAMEARLGDVQSVSGNNTYKYAQLITSDGQPISVVLTRVVGQGNLKAQGVASNIIHDLDPAWLILVGIAGGVPDNEYSLGDVVLATYLHDFSLTAASDDGVTRQVVGGEMHRDVIRFLSTRAVGGDAKRMSELAGFDKDPQLINHPPVYSDHVAANKRYYGSTSFRKEVKRSIEARFPDGKRKSGPWIRQGPCANGNLLLKSTTLLTDWKQSARHIIDVEMELAGVYEAAKSAGRENYPVLAIRGLSDIVGFARDPDWTGYACKTAAVFASAVLRSGFIDFEKNLPQKPSIGSSVSAGASPVSQVQPAPREIRADISRIDKYAPAELIGRDDELKTLWDAWQQAVNGKPKRPHILTFVALGGEGKTSLVAKWTADLAYQGWPGCEAAFAWSFYSQGTSEKTQASSDSFLKEALLFFGDIEMANSPVSSFDKGRRLAQLVSERHALLILDGVEPLQYAPTSPTGSELKDQGVAALLKALASNNNGLCVVTTRYSIPELRNFWQTTAPEIKLSSLSIDAGVALLRRLGVKGIQNEFEQLVRDVKGHALTLNLLGSF